MHRKNRSSTVFLITAFVSVCLFGGILGALYKIGSLQTQLADAKRQIATMEQEAASQATLEPLRAYNVRLVIRFDPLGGYSFTKDSGIDFSVTVNADPESPQKVITWKWDDGVIPKAQLDNFWRGQFKWRLLDGEGSYNINSDQLAGRTLVFIGQRYDQDASTVSLPF